MMKKKDNVKIKIFSIGHMNIIRHLVLIKCQMDFLMGFSGTTEGISPSEDLKRHTVKVFPRRIVLLIETWDLTRY